LDCGGLTPLFLFACVQRRQKRRQAAALQTKKPFHPIKKDGTVNEWLFLPSTVLTVSGSRGLHRLPISDLRLPIEKHCSQIGNWHSAIGNGRTLSPGLLLDRSSPESCLLSISQCDSRTLQSRVQCRDRYATMTTLPTTERSNYNEVRERKTIMTAEIGKRFPDFSLQNQDGKTVALDDYAGKWLVLYVYPKDDTPGCTIQGKSFTASKQEFDEAGIAVVGVSADDVASHKDFCNKFAFTIDLLADPNHELLEAAGVGQSDYKGTMYWDRTSFVIDPKGTLRKIYLKVNPEGHERVLLDDIKTMKETGRSAAQS